MKIKYLGIIPARGGSKRVGRKNLVPLFNKPLLYWTIKAAQESKLLDDFVVSTEDSTIKWIVDSYGVKVIDRPINLAGDDVGMTPVVKHVLKEINAENVVILRPTSPIRINNLIDKCIREYENQGGDSLMTGFINYEYEWFTHEDTPSQLTKGWFQGNGCVEITHRDVIMEDKTYGDEVVKFITPEIYNYEIDTELDFTIIEAIMKHIGLT